MLRFFSFFADRPKTVLAALVLLAALGVHTWRRLAVDVFPDISVPRVTIMTEAGGLTAEEVEQRVTIPIESAVNGIPGVATVRSSSSGGLSFVWVDFDWNADLARARFDVFERLSRVQDALPAEAHAEIAPVVSVTGEIMLVALLAKDGRVSPLDVRERAEYDLRTRLMAVPGIGEVAVIGGRLPEYRVAADPRRLAAAGLALSDVLDAARDSRTFLSAGYLAHVAGEEVPLRQVARADTLASLRAVPIPLPRGGSLRLSDVADVTVSGAPRRGSASFNGHDAVVLSVQKTPGGNTPALTAALEKTLADFAATVKDHGIEIRTDAYRQADFIAASVAGAGTVVRDAVIVVVLVLLVTLLELRTILVVLCTMPFAILAGLALFPHLGLGVNVMTLGGFAVAAGDIVDAAIIFTEVARRKLGENAARGPAARPIGHVIAEAVASVTPSVLFSTLIVALVFVPLLMLTGLEGRFFRPLALAYLCLFALSLVTAACAVPALARLVKPGVGKRPADPAHAGVSAGIRALRALYRPFLAGALRFPKTTLLLAAAAFAAAIHVAAGFGSSFLPPFREDAFNVMLSLPPGASLAETARVSEACVPALRAIPGVLSVTRRTGRAERDQHAEPVSSSEFVVRVDLSRDTEAIRAAIRERLGAIPGCALVVGYPIAHRISAVLSGTEAEVAVNVFGEEADVLRETVAEMKKALDGMPELADVRANREITVRSFRIDYDMAALAEAGLTPREAGEQVSAAFNGAEVGEVRRGLRRRAVIVRLAGDENTYGADTVKSLLLSGRTGTRVRLDDVARIIPEDAPNLLLREGGRRKALISCNPAPGVDTGRLVERIRERLAPLAEKAGCTLAFGGTCEARAQAARRLGVLGAGLLAAVFFLLVLALGSARGALLALLNVPLALTGAVVAVALADPVLSVSSLVGFVTVTGFTLRNGLLLLNSYQTREADGADRATAIREGSLERMAPIVLTSLTTVIGLVPIMYAGQTPGGELLAPLAIVQFGGLIGAMLLNLVVLPAAALTFGTGRETSGRRAAVAACVGAALLVGTPGCRSYTPAPIDWDAELRAGVTNEVRLASPDDAATLALVGNRAINALRLKAARSEAVAKESGWWEDPSFDVDLLRILQSSSHPFLGCGALSFSIPLSGARARDADAADAYARADRIRIRAAERTLAADARQTAIRLAALHERVRLLHAHENDPRLVQAHAHVEKLHAAGEIDAPARASAHRVRHARHHALMEAVRERDETEIALLEQLGLRPGTKLTLTFVPDAPAAGLPPAPDVRTLIRHPDVEAAGANLDGAEAALDAEIRRQYPDLALGPAYANEEGLDRLGLAAGITLPLWNRNRKGIAEAEGVRDEARLNVLDTWRTCVCRAATAHASLANLLAHPSAPANERRDADALTDAGELTPLDYLTVREEILDQKLAEAEWRRDVALARAEYEKTTL